MNQLFKFGIILGAICLIATLVLAVTYEITKPKIDQELKREEQNALRTIIPQADSFNEKSLDGIEYFEALKGKTLVGYCIRITASGYNGYIRLITGINTEGIIEGVEILEHYETPGLGAKINEVKQGEKEPYFLRQFKGKPATSIEVKKNIDAITGATVSSKAVTDAVNRAVTEFLNKKGK